MYGRLDSENDLNKVDELLTLSACPYHVKSREERFVAAAAGTQAAPFASMYISIKNFAMKQGSLLIEPYFFVNR